MSSIYNTDLIENDYNELKKLFGQLRIDPNNEGFQGYVRRAFSFNKFVDEACACFQDTRKGRAERIQQIQQRLSDFNNIIFDSNRVLTFLDALATFSRTAEQGRCFGRPTFREKYDAIVAKLFKIELTPNEALAEGNDLEGLSTKIVGQFLKVLLYHSDRRKLGIKQDKHCEDAIRCRLISGYSYTIGKIQQQLSSIQDPALLLTEKGFRSTQEKKLRLEMDRLYKLITAKSVKTAAKKAIKEFQK